MKQDQETEADPEFQARLDAVLSAMKAALANDFARLQNARLTNPVDYWTGMGVLDGPLQSYALEKIRKEILRQKYDYRMGPSRYPRLGMQR